MRDSQSRRERNSGQYLRLMMIWKWPCGSSRLAASGLTRAHDEAVACSVVAACDESGSATLHGHGWHTAPACNKPCQGMAPTFVHRDRCWKQLRTPSGACRQLWNVSTHPHTTLSSA